MTVTISSFRHHIKDILEKVKKGKVVEITQRGKVIAKINPIQNERDWLNHELEQIRKNSKITGDIISPISDEDISLDLDNFK